MGWNARYARRAHHFSEVPHVRNSIPHPIPHFDEEWKNTLMNNLTACNRYEFTAKTTLKHKDVLTIGASYDRGVPTFSKASSLKEPQTSPKKKGVWGRRQKRNEIPTVLG